MGRLWILRFETNAVAREKKEEKKNSRGQTLRRRDHSTDSGQADRVLVFLPATQPLVRFKPGCRFRTGARPMRSLDWAPKTNPRILAADGKGPSLLCELARIKGHWVLAVVDNQV